MLLGKKRKIGKGIKDISIGEKFTVTERMEDKELLLYLGLTGDSNPLYIQHDYASLTAYQKPVVPNIMLLGIMTSAVSKYFPGPGSYITKQEISYLKPVYHYETVTFMFTVIEIKESDEQVVISIVACNEEEDPVIEATMAVCPPQLVDER